MQNKVNEQNVLYFVFYRLLPSQKFHVRAISSDLDLMLIENYLNVFGAEYEVQPNLLPRNVITNGTRN